MSFPPRPPMGHNLGMPGVMPPGYGFPPPMGMMPMRMMPMMRPPTMMTGHHHPYRYHQPQRNPFPPDIQKPPSQEDKDKPPVTTVFVGNISDKAPDTMIRQMLQRCGTVLSWKRVQGASGKLQAFGFCEYESPEATMRCMRLLNDWLISDKKLVVKVDAKTKDILDEYKAKKLEKKKELLESLKQRKNEAKDEEPEEGETKESDEEEEAAASKLNDGSSQPQALDELTLREDRVAQGSLDAVMREFSADIAKAQAREEQQQAKKAPQKQERYDEGPKDSTLDDMEIDDMKKDLINKEIRSFREVNKKNDKNYEEDKERRKRRDDDRDRRDREREREKERDRERERERERERRDREREEQERREKERREAERERHRATRSRSKTVDREEEDVDLDEIHEQKKVERKLREKEAHYQELLTQWEARERKKGREYEKEEEREDERKTEEVKEARRLKEFLEDYDDEKDDPKYYKGSALQRRMKEREKEMEADERDRQKEKEEIEEIRRKLLEEGSEDVEAEIARLESEKDAHLMPRLALSPSPSPPPPPRKRSPSPRARSPSQSPPNEAKPGFIPVTEPADIPLGSPRMQHPQEDEDSRHSFKNNVPYQEISPVPAPDSPKPGYSGARQESASNSPADFGNKRKKLTVGDVFNQEDDGGDGPKKRKLIPLDYEEEKRLKPITLPIVKPTTAEEKRKCIKSLIEKIPTAKDELFAYPLDWTMVDRSLMDKRIRPWVNKKIAEYIGDEEPTLSDFICQKVITHSAPASILTEIAMVFDEEAEVFVVKMWRLLIYETEAKKLGLVK